MNVVLVHPFAGVLSAYGMGLADVRALRERTVEARLDEEVVPRLMGELDELATVLARFESWLWTTRNSTHVSLETSASLSKTKTSVVEDSCSAGCALA